MTRWAPDAALRLEQAAIELFEEQGYTATTVPQITARAGLTTRSFFRHFPDKREVLFLRDREFPDVVRVALESLPPSLEPAALIERGLAAATEPLDQWREPIERRRAIIRAELPLRERELLKSALLSDAVRQALTARRVPAPDARVLAALSTLVFDTALDDWLDGPAGETLASTLRATWARVRSIAAQGHDPMSVAPDITEV